MNPVLVTGGAGFIGSHVCEAFLKRRIPVICVDNLNNFYSPELKLKNLDEVVKTSKLMPGAVFNFEKIDILDTSSLASLFGRYNFSCVVHLAAYAGVRPSIENPALYFGTNVMGTLNLLDQMKSHGVKKFLFASSSSVYGNNKKVPFAETDPVDNPISPYAATKKAGELLCFTYHHLFGIDTACLRFFTVYGERQRPDLAIHKFTRLISEGKPIQMFGDGATRRDYTYIGDIVDGVTKAYDYVTKNQGVYDIFNLGESNTISLSWMISAIEAAIGKKAVINRMPVQPGDVELTNADISKAVRVIGYAPKTDFDDGIKIFVKWFSDNFHA